LLENDRPLIIDPSLQEMLSDVYSLSNPEELDQLDRVVVLTYDSSFLHEIQ
jgi:hypothetical protein